MVQYAGFYIYKNSKKKIYVVNYICKYGQNSLVLKLFDSSWNKEKVLLKMLLTDLSNKSSHIRPDDITPGLNYLTYCQLVTGI